MPGHSGSDAFNHNGYDLRLWYREMLIGVLDELGWDSVHVIGHSQGAIPCVGWARTHLLGLPKPRKMYQRVLASTVGEHDFAAIPADLIQTNYLATRRPGFGCHRRGNRRNPPPGGAHF